MTRSLGTLRWQLVAVDGVVIAVIGVVGLLYARSTLRPIRENVAAQKRFIADASHELRTPLAVMKSEFEVSLRQEPQDAEVRRVLVSGLEEVDRMSEMVEDLLTLSRIDAHQERLALGPFDLAELARQTTEKFRSLAAGAGVELAFASDGPAPAVGDARHVGARPLQRRQERPRALALRRLCRGVGARLGDRGGGDGRRRRRGHPAGGARPRLRPASIAPTRRAPRREAARASVWPSRDGRCERWAATSVWRARRAAARRRRSRLPGAAA